MTQILCLVAGVLFGLGATQLRIKRWRGEHSNEAADRPVNFGEVAKLIDECGDALGRLMERRQVKKCENLRRVVYRLDEAKIMLAKCNKLLHEAVHPELYPKENTNV